MTRGLNTVASAIKLTNEEARDLQDIDFFPIGGWSKRNGYTKLDTTSPDSNPVTGLYMARYNTSGGINLAYRVSGTKIYKMISSLGGTWTDITGGLTITTGQNNVWCFDILNNIVVLGNGTDSPIQIDFTGAASVLTAGMPWTTFKFPVQVRGYMWYFVPTVGGSVKYDRGYFSSINDPATVGTNNYVDIGLGQDGGVMGAVDYKTYLYVFKRSGIYQITYQPTRVDSSGTIFPWTQFPNPVVPGVGTQSHRSIVKFTTPETHATPGQELVFFVDQFGIPRIFDGVTTISFASKIGTSRDTTILSLSDMVNSRLPYCFSVNYPSRSRIIFWLSSNGTDQNRPWVLDYSTGFSISRYKYNLSFNSAFLFEKSDGSFKPYAGDLVGAVHQLDQGTTDNGQPISDYYVTGDFSEESPMIRNKFYALEMRGQNGSTSQFTKISYYIDGLDTPVNTDTKSLAKSQTQWCLASSHSMIWGQSQWAKKGIQTATSEINEVAKTLRVKIESSNKTSDTLIMEGWAVTHEPLGTAQA